MNEGKDLCTLQNGIGLPPECEVGQGYGKLNWSIRAIWENYAGWFKHESTTELYSVPQTTIHADLARLAGADQLVQLAEGKAAAGEHEQALHLLDIVLNADPGHAGARALAIRVHETLLADARTFCTTGNFWLVGWLQNRIKVLKGGIDAGVEPVGARLAVDVAREAQRAEVDTPVRGIPRRSGSCPTAIPAARLLRSSPA
jgi:alkyl sulfatase BDS1-like metallo-beta-lactamase superfamily hydrolase